VSAVNGCTWTAASNDSWITVTSGTIGNGNGTVGFTVLANQSNVRNGTLTIAGQTLTVQQGTNCTFTLNRLNINAPAAGASRSVGVVASGPLCNWTASTSTPWITITAGASAVGNDTVQILIAPNTGAARAGSLVVAGQTVTVNQ
jgi:hypothetical protein